MMRLALLLPLLLAIAACASEEVAGDPPPASDDPVAVPDPQDASPTPTPTSTPESELEEVASLAGEWRVAGIDGGEFNESYGLALSADAEEIWWDPRCAQHIRGYTIDGHAIEFGPATTEPPVSTSTPAPVCAIGPPPRLSEVFRALDAATRIGRTSSNGVLIEGGGHSLLLFSQ